MRLELSRDEVDEASHLQYVALQKLEIDRRELVWSVSLAYMAASGEHQKHGFANPVDWLRIWYQMGEGAIRDRICVGQELKQLPASEALVESGEIGFAHLVLIARTRQALRRTHGAGFEFDEHKLLKRARTESVGRFFYTCENYRHACDADAYAQAVEDLHEQRELTIRRRQDGMSTLWGRLDPVTAASLRAALVPLAKRQGRDDGRSFKQRLHDAVAERLGANAPAHVNVTIAAETLLAWKGSPAGEIEGQPPIGQATIERITCDCSVRRIVLDPRSVVIDVGRDQRVVGAPGRQALDARDRGCVWPGCERPASWSSPHHLVHWARGGTTDLSNQVLLCYFHHRRVHEGGWQIFREADGRVSTLRPPPTFGPWPRGPSFARAV
jgi:hypothetical protein